MLKYLRVRNFVLIAEADLEFEPGLCTITGETGAGKTILLEALSLVLGERASPNLVREGAESASVEAVFEYDPKRELGRSIETLLSDAGIECGDRQLIVRRIVSASGPSRCFVNGSPVVLKTLSELGDLLVDVHGQHEHQSLLRPESYLRFVDIYGELEEARRQLGERYETRRRLRAEMAELATDRENRTRELDLLRFQVDEIEQASIEDPEEIEALRGELERLRHVEELRAAAASIHALAEGDDAGDAGVSGRLSELERIVDRMVALDASCRWMVDDVLAARGYVDDIGRRMVDYAERLEADPQRLLVVEERLHALASLAHKHGGSLARVLEYHAEARARLDRLEHSDDRLEQLGVELSKLEEQLAAEALELSKRRAKVAATLSRTITAEIRQLGMSDAQFKIELASLPDPEGLPVEGVKRLRLHPTGIDQAEFLLAVNYGTSPAPLRQVASGGEISRVMLGIKTVLAKAARIPSMIFDEIDAGVGGQIGEVVARKLAALAAHHQVVCITHLAGIASRADHNLVVDKAREGKTTVVKIRTVSGKDKLEEMVRLLGSSVDSRAAVKMAREMLESAREERGKAVR